VAIIGFFVTDKLAITGLYLVSGWELSGNQITSPLFLKATLKNEIFSPRSRRVREFYRRHIVDISRIKFSRATKRLER